MLAVPDMHGWWIAITTIPALGRRAYYNLEFHPDKPFHTLKSLQTFLVPYCTERITSFAARFFELEFISRLTCVDKEKPTLRRAEDVRERGFLLRVFVQVSILLLVLEIIVVVCSTMFGCFLRDVKHTTSRQ